MGVQGLWPLLEPVGRRVNIEALTNKRLAVGKIHQYFYGLLSVARSIGLCSAALQMPPFGSYSLLRPCAMRKARCYTMLTFSDSFVESVGCSSTGFGLCLFSTEQHQLSRNAQPSLADGNTRRSLNFHPLHSTILFLEWMSSELRLLFVDDVKSKVQS